MKYKSKVQTARQKYLQTKPLSTDEQTVIERDFKGKDYQYYKANDNKHLLLAEEYSAENTYRNIETRITSKQSFVSRSWFKYASSIAAVCVLAIFSLYIYQLVSAPSLISISTSYGEQREIILPDGSVATLNSLSSITYPQNLDGDIREINLKGEAYFDIVKNQDKPFVVKIEDLRVKVLGTKFNITAYENEENITTSLLEGSVSVNSPDGHISILVPNDQSIYNKREKTVQLRNSENIVNEILWASGKLFFDNEPLNQILNTLEREKHVSFDLKNSNLGMLRITANFDKGESIEDILSILAESGEFTYSINSNSVIISQ